VLSPQNALYWHWEMQSWLARYIGGKPHWRSRCSTPKPGKVERDLRARFSGVGPALAGEPFWD